MKEMNKNQLSETDMQVLGDETLEVVAGGGGAASLQYASILIRGIPWPELLLDIKQFQVQQF